MERFILQTVFGILLNALIASCVNVDLSKDTSLIKPWVTVNVSITCSVSETTNHYYRNGRYQNTQSDGDLIKIRVLRKPVDGMTVEPWKVMAQLSDTDNIVRIEVDGIQADGRINKNTMDGSFLKVTWPKAVAETLGTFMCDALTVKDETAKLTRASNLEIGNDLKGEDFARILYEQKMSAFEATEQFKNDVERQLQNITDTVKQVLSAQSQKISEMESNLKGVFDSGFLLYWPAGSYALLEPQTGCPTDGANAWAEGIVRHHSESTQRNQDEVSSPSHLKGPVLSRENAQNFVTQHFCVKTSANVAGPLWPAGSYCINAKGGSCSAGFKEGHILFDEENTNNKGNHTGELPDGDYLDNTKIFYCCRNDGSLKQPIYLPTSLSFYLYRNGGRCQEVYGMNVTSEFLLVDTENDENKDESTGLPDVNINNVRLELCYYESI